MNPTNINDKSSSDNEEIDLRQVINTLLRKKRYILSASFLSIFIGIFSSITTKQVWEGHFQIVLKDSNSKQFGGQMKTSAGALSLVGLGGDRGSLRTEVLILQSPSILNPIYDYVKSYKLNSKQNISNFNFYKWRDENLDINLKKGTSVLSISYRDTDKYLILPVMKKLTKSYQNYSGSKREKGITQGINYLKDQIKILNSQSKQSLAKLQTFAIENNLGSRDGLPMPANVSFNSNQIKTMIGLGSEDKFKAVQNTNLSSIGGASKFDERSNRFINQYSELAKLESLLIEKSINLTPSSSYIKSLKAKINSLRNSLSRSPEILLRFRELNQNARRDEEVLLQLQSDLQTLQLDQAKQSNPWKIISKPTLLDHPVAPHKKRIVSLWFLGGIIFGSALALIIEKTSGRIYSIEYLKKTLKFKLLKQISFSSTNWSNSIKLLNKSLKDKENIALIPIGEFWSESQIDLISDSFKKEMSPSKIIVSNDLIKTSKCSTQLLLFSAGSCTKDNLQEIIEDLIIQKGPIEGWIFIND